MEGNCGDYAAAQEEQKLLRARARCKSRDRGLLQQFKPRLAGNRSVTPSRLSSTTPMSAFSSRFPDFSLAAWFRQTGYLNALIKAHST
jgi:hypothetical protein